MQAQKKQIQWKLSPVMNRLNPITALSGVASQTRFTVVLLDFLCKFEFLTVMEVW